MWALVGSGQDPDELLGKEPGAVADLDFHLAHTWPGMTTARLAGDVLAEQLDLLAAWVRRVPEGSSLILITDGDQ